MKQRVITAIFILLVIVPLLLAKILYDVNDYLYILSFILAIVAMNEMLSTKEREKNLPFEVHIISYLAVIYIAFADSFVVMFKNSVQTINILPYLLIIFMILTVLRNHFKVKDASFVLFAIYYIGLSFFTLVQIFLRTNGIYELIYIILIAVFTDTSAYFIGTFFGKHKLCPDISPKKTKEGSVGGTILATILVMVYVLLVPKFTFLYDNIFYKIGLTFLLSIISQFGDLALSVVKRQFSIKDFGNLFPGHGGVLDRLDSILFTSLTYYYLTELLTSIF